MFTKSTQYLKLRKLLINCKIRNSEYSITIKLCITLLLQHTVPRWSAAILASQYRSYIQNRFNKTTRNYTRSSFFSVCRSAYHQRTHNSAACVSPHAHWGNPCVYHGTGEGYTRVILEMQEYPHVSHRQTLTFDWSSYPVLNGRLNRMFVVVWVLHLLTPITQVSQNTHTVLYDLVPDIRLLDGGSYYVKKSVDQTFALAQFLPRILASARDVS